MASNSLHCLHHTVLHHPDTPTAATPSTHFLKPTTTIPTLSITTTSRNTKTSSLTPSTAAAAAHSITSARKTKTFSPNTVAGAAATTSAETSAVGTYDTLRKHLSEQDFRQADEETRTLLIKLAGEASENRGYVFFSEVQFIPEEDLKGIEDLWIEFSNGKFGYSVQKKIWKRLNSDFSRFFVKVGWMKKLDTEVEQYNYKAFPNEFFWDNNDDTPEGHLPLTNALRGTQLLTCILNHPAFDNGEDEVSDGEEESSNGGISPLLSTNNRVLSSDYSF